MLIQFQFCRHSSKNSTQFIRQPKFFKTNNGSSSKRTTAFINPQAAAQLAVLPTFSNVFKDDNFTSTQWLQKVINHKTGAAWTDEQTITHVINTFIGDLIDWLDSLTALGIDSVVWDNVKRHLKPTLERHHQ